MNTQENQDRGQDRDAVEKVAPEGAARNFKRRVASAAVLAPVAIAAAYVGGWAFLIVCAIAAAAVLWEWTMLVARSAEPRILAPGLAALAVATGRDKGEPAASPAEKPCSAHGLHLHDVGTLSKAGDQADQEASRRR